MAPGTRSAHDFVWRHQQQPYDLTVYQVGNSSHHDYLWPYLFRYPGLTVLHDAHLHHARAAALLRTLRAADYRAEFAWNHPDVNPDLAELAVAGFDNHLYYAWPMTRLVARAPRDWSPSTAPALAAPPARLKFRTPPSTAIRLGQGTPLSTEEAQRRRDRARARYGISRRRGRVRVLRRPDAGQAHPAGAGGVCRHARLCARPRICCWRAPCPRTTICDATSRATASSDGVTLTGYLESDEALTDSIAACDVALNLRWPTAREVSGPWLRCLAAGKPTVIVDLAHLADVPSLDPRTWRPTVRVGHAVSDATAALRRRDRHPRRGPLAAAGDAAAGHRPALRARSARPPGTCWQREALHRRMVEDYRALIAEAVRRPAPAVALPAHLLDDGSGTLERLIEPFGLASPLGPSPPSLSV